MVKKLLLCGSLLLTPMLVLGHAEPASAHTRHHSRRRAHHRRNTTGYNCIVGQKPTLAEHHRCWADALTHDGEFRYQWSVREALAVSYCESKGDALIKNGRSSATGLFQVLRGSRDPRTNINQAYSMWRTRGWQPWKTCPYKRYL